MQDTNSIRKLKKFGLHMIFDIIPGKVCVATDINCKEIICNLAAAQFFGVNSCSSLFTIEGCPPYKLFCRGRELSPSELPLQRAWLGEEILGEELEVLCLNGLKKHTIWNSRPLRDNQGNIIAAMCTFEDITEKKRLDEEIRRKEKQYRLLLNNIPGLVLWSNKAGNIQFANEYAVKFFRPWLGSPRNRPLLDIAVPTAGQSCTHEYLLPDGRQVWIHWTFKKYAHPVTQTPGILCVGFDITGQHRASQVICREYELRYRTDLLNKALRSEISPQEFNEMAIRSGIHFPDKSLLHIIQIREVPSDWHQSRRKQGQARLNQLIVELSLQTSGVAWQSAAGIAILVPVPHIGATGDPADILLTLAKKVFPGQQIRIGIAGLTANPPDLLAAYQQAVFALRAGPAAGQKNPVCRWQELGILQLMSACCDSDQSRAFIQAELGSLLEYDKIRASCLVDTLEQILTADSVAAITRQLHIHEKTVLFRKRKIEHILGTTIDSYAKKLNLLMAIRLLRLQSGPASEYR